MRQISLRKRIAKYANRMAIVNEVHNVLKTAGIEDQAPKVNLGVGEHLRNQAADPLDEWTATVMRNMKRMATDEAYRLSIAKYLS